ncbi:hypothetical protein ACF0H5_011631 [Mactra antiquata]
MEFQQDVNNEERTPLEKKTKISGTTPDLQTHGDVDTGWSWIILTACFGNFCLFGCAQYASGIIHSLLLERYGASVYITSWAGSLHVSLISLAGPLSSAISDRYSCRVAIVTGGCMYISGYILTAIAPTVQVAIVTCGVISGIGGGIAYSANTVIISYNFRKRRMLGIGVAHTGIGVGVLVLAPLLQFLRELYGSFGFFLMLAGIFANMITFGMVCFPNSVERITLNKNLNSLPTKERPISSNRLSVCSFFNKYWEVFTNRGIFCLCVANFFYSVSLFVLYLYFPTFIMYRGFTATEAAFFLSISGILNIFGRLGAGILANIQTVNILLLYSTTIVLFGLGTIIYPFIASYFAGHVVYFVVLGFFMGPCNVLTTGASLEFVSVEKIAIAIGLQLGFGGIGATIGPIITGLFLDNGGTYEQAIIIAGSCAVLAAICSGITICFNQHSDNTVLDIPENEGENHNMLKIKDIEIT